MDNYFMILDIFLVAVLFLFLIITLIRGFKKSLIRFLSLLAASILLFVFINPVTNRIKDVEFDISIIEKVVDLPDDLTEEKQSVSSLVNYGVSELLFDGSNEMKENSKTASLILSISSMVVKICIYTSGLGVVWFLQFLFRIIFRLLLGKKKWPKPLLSMSIGLLHYLLLFILVFLPILGTASLASQIIIDIEEVTCEMDEKPVDLSGIMPYVEQYENTITKKVVMKTATRLLCKNKDISIDAQYVGKALSFSTDDAKVKFIDEYILIRNAIPSIMEIIDVAGDIKQTESNKVDLSKLSDEDIENISNVFKNSQLIRALIPVALEISINKVEEQTSDYTEILKAFEELNWDVELNALANLIDVFKDYNNIEISTNDFNSIITSNGVINLVEAFSNKAFELGIITDVMLPMIILSIEEENINGELGEYDIDFSVFKTIDWKNEGPVLISSILNIYRSYLTLNYTESYIKVLLQNELLPNFIETLFDELNETTIVTEKVLPLVMQIVVSKLMENEDSLDLEINLEEFKEIKWNENLSSIKEVLLSFVTAYQELKIDPDNFKEVFDNSSIQNYITDLTDAVLECNIITEYFLDFIMNKLIDKLAESESLKDFDINIEEVKKLDWEEELKTFSDSFVVLINIYQESNFEKDEWTLIIDDPKFNDYLTNAVDALMKSRLFKEYILPAFANKINSYIDNNEFSVDMSFVKELITEESIVELLNNDIDKLVIILRDLKAINVFEGDSQVDFKDQVCKEKFIEVIKTVFNLSIINNKEEQIFRSLINIVNFESILESFNITLKYENVTNWKEEIDVICEIIDGMLNVAGDINDFDINTLLQQEKSEESKLAIALLIEDIGRSNLMKDSIYYIIESAISNVSSDYEITFSEESKYYIENVSGWKEETLHLLNLIDRIKVISMDENYKDLDALEIRDIMLYCSECEITTILFGTVLNSIFSGVIEHDFTKKEVMKQDAEVIYNTIKLANMVQQPTFDLNDEASAKDLVDTISNLAENEQSIELTNQLLSNIVDENKEFDYTKDDIQDAAEVINDIIDVYQNSENQDEFDLENLPEEELEKLENSELGKLILELFFGK